MTVSKSIIQRMIATLNESAKISHAALGMVSDDAYCDFFVENGGNGKPFHEKCQMSDLTKIEFNKTSFSAGRMKGIQRVADDGGGYCDFFVENGGDGRPFHEKCQTANIAELVTNPVARASALGRLGVIEAFNNAQLSAIKQTA